jgi:hypothetical protein
MITLEKLEIYENCKGFQQALERGSASISEERREQLFGNGDWTLIDNFYFSIELINKNLVAKSFIEDTIKSIEQNCDAQSLNFLKKKIVLF